jgi:hypothetical protein
VRRKPVEFDVVEGHLEARTRGNGTPRRDGVIEAGVFASLDSFLPELEFPNRLAESSVGISSISS